MKRLLIVLLLAASVANAQGAASHSDSAVLSTDPTYQNRVQESLLAYCVQTVVSEDPRTVVNHKQRATLCELAVTSPASFKTLFAATTATDTTILADATQAGTVALTSGNVAAQAALATDAHIDNAVAAEFNTFLLLP
jgi:hypothetical protein